MKRDGMQNLKFIQIVLKIVRVTVDNEPVASVQSTYDQSMMLILNLHHGDGRGISQNRLTK